MYKKRKNRYETLRINRFKGLNQADNPRNIDDAELSVMKNLCLEKDGTIKSRKGWQIVSGNLTVSNTVRGMHKTYWEDVGSAVYMMGNYKLFHVNETNWAVTSMGTIGGGTEHASFLRYKDKLLFLFPGQELKYINSANALSTVYLPQPKADGTASQYLAASAGGNLEPLKTYQYAVSFLFGQGHGDGESVLSLPAEAWAGWEWVWIGGMPVLQYTKYPESHPYEATTADNKTITGTAQPFSCNLKGYDVTKINLFRRKADKVTGGYTSDDPWELIDTAAIQKTEDGTSYELLFNTCSGVDDDGEAVGVITEIGGTYNSGTDEATVTITFIDNGTVAGGYVHQPRTPDSDYQPKAKYMARLYNRVLLANIQGTSQESDKKKVYFSYRGDTGLGEGSNAIWEIPDFVYPHPMLIFPPDNFFYCDMEDPEDEITGLATYQDNVLIFTSKCTFLWREGLFEPMKVANDVGCLSDSSICEFEGKLIWLAKNGVYQYDGSKVKNLTYEKVANYIRGIGASTAHKASGAIYDRKYFLAAPFESATANNMVLVYDFDLDEWYIYKYMFNLNTNEQIYVDYLFNYSDGAKETLYAGAHRTAALQTFLTKLESGYSDYWYHAANSSDGIPIDYELRTKYFDFEAPDIEKALRNAYIRLCGYSGGATFDTYVDQIDSADNSTLIPVPAVGFLIAGADTVDEEALGLSVLAGAEGTTGDYLENVGNTACAISLPQGLTGAAFQFGLSGRQWGAQLEIKSLGADWLPKRRVARTIGG